MIDVVKIGEHNGQDILLFTLKNAKIDVGILNFGGIMKHFKVRTPEGDRNIVFGVESVEEYLRKGNYTSAVIGRVANCIRHASFVLGENTCTITKNDGEHCNHGGVEGFDRRFFGHEICGDSLILSLDSPDGDQGFPGNLHLNVEYQLEEDAVTVRFTATSDADTVFAPTYHPYFNLSSHTENIYDTKLFVNAKQVAVVGKDGFPTGEFMDVKGTPFDFSTYTPVGQGLQSGHEQIAVFGGYNHCFLTEGDHVAGVYSEKTGLELNIYSNLPGVQLYTSNIEQKYPQNDRFFKHCAICLEPQFFPNAVNTEAFETPFLAAGERADYTIRYAVSVRDKGVTE
ncbi:MAG: galactose mutarotase [Clostridia bacterium]|nr:galactose mutarotase [Clostridia bacterium]